MAPVKDEVTGQGLVQQPVMEPGQAMPVHRGRAAVQQPPPDQAFAMDGRQCQTVGIPPAHANGRDPQAVAGPFHPQGQKRFGETVGFLRLFRPRDPYLAQRRVECRPDIAMVGHMAGQPHGHCLKAIEVGLGWGGSQSQGQCETVKPTHVRWPFHQSANAVSSRWGQCELTAQVDRPARKSWHGRVGPPACPAGSGRDRPGVPKAATSPHLWRIWRLLVIIFIFSLYVF